VDEGVEQAEATLDRLEEVGVDLADVSRTIEDEGITAFEKSFEDLLGALKEKASS
jgi:transaldolase